ncbi:hypothetical protein P691DRAFT_778476 [Macrolepiota fuliginosa MF-IS2]|uniref:Peptide hydrolase n=1 Tax=Macrolepiota fuliginosa MF-IS2 TaxID=1400762 RepID=A0A9P5X7C7_9AGAR|nr:hypothetical protein P691DRAFT_778476 [Macrolepiota fuliginosa MF-IS2]
MKFSTFNKIFKLGKSFSTWLLYSVFGFRTNAVTTCLILVYFVVFVGVIVSDSVSHAPKDSGELNLEQAYRDLHRIAARPRPVLSHANDDVRAYVLSRLQNVTQNIPYAHVVEDIGSNATWADDNVATSFEGMNILIKVDGTDPELATRGGVLFSAHLDSVSTGPGATDDAIGVVCLMTMVEYLSTKARTQRTAIFNINNGEEDGLHGAHLLLEHPWSTIPDTFINLEGAGAGGRPLLFRATSLAPVRSFKNTAVSRPHGNVLSADAFARGVIRSGTDFEVYAKGLGSDTAMEGIDFAFYQRRSKYHTRFDSVPSADGGRDSIWAMLETVRGAGISLLNDAGTHVGNGRPQPPVYFDLFGRSLVVFTQRGLFIFDVVMLIVGPLILLLLHHIPDYKSPSSAISRGQQGRAYLLSLIQHLSTWKFTSQTGTGFWIWSWWWGKFWAIFIFGIVFQVILVATILNANRYIVHSQPYVVLISMLTLPSLLVVFFTHVPFGTGGPPYSNQQRLTMIYQLYILAWILLVIGTVILNKFQIGGTYFLTGWYIFTFLAAITGSTERTLRYWKLAQSQRGPTPISSSSEEEHGLQDHPTLPSSSHGAPSVTNQKTDPVKKPKPHEQTPLLVRKPLLEQQQEAGSAGWWILQLLLLVVIPVILVSHLLLLFLAALSQTLSDGSSPVIVYAGSAALSLLTALPLTPFAFKIHRSVIILGFLIFSIATIYNWSAFPFSQDAPLKVFFQQSVEIQLTPGNPPSQRVVHAISSLTGVPDYIQFHVVSQLPSSWTPNANVQCTPDGSRSGTSTCRWETALIPSPGGLDAQTPWFTFTASRLNTTSALITVSGRDTRACRLYFDNRAIKAYDVYTLNADGTQSPSGRRTQAGYEIPSTGLMGLWLWSRTWDRNFTVAVTWDVNDGVGATAGLSGRVACEWAEYTSGMVGMELTNSTTIPAYEEILSYLPAWAVSTKTTDGLMEAWTNFTTEGGL